MGSCRIQLTWQELFLSISTRKVPLLNTLRCIKGRDGFTSLNVACGVLKYTNSGIFTFNVSHQTNCVYT